MEVMMNISHHSRRRAIERTGCGKSAVYRRAQEALEYGLTYETASGLLKRWIILEFHKRRTADNIRVLHGIAWLFHGSRLITVKYAPVCQRLAARSRIATGRQSRNARDGKGRGRDD
jgi:hypothetical protein